MSNLAMNSLYADTFSDHMLHSMHAFVKLTDQAQSSSLFRTNTNPRELWNAYLSALPDERRQEHNCNCCRHFVERYGGLVRVGEGGRMFPAFLNEGHGMYAPVVEAMRNVVLKSTIVGAFRDRNGVLGTSHSPKRDGSGYWQHMHVKVKPTKSSDKYSDSQLEALANEELKMLRSGLSEFKVATFEQANDMFKSGKLSETKHGELASWLYELKKMLGTRRYSEAHKTNLLWVAVSDAPAGWAHVKSGMIGTLLEDIEAGMSLDSIVNRYNEKMHPLRYLRPTEAPKAGAVVAARKLFEQMGLEPSLHRRLATEDDIQKWLWRPRVQKSDQAEQGGLFSNLKTRTKKGDSQKPETLSSSSPTTMTWRAFAEKVLPNASEIRAVLRDSENFVALQAAVDPDSKPVLQWDHPDHRNTVNHYVYMGGSLRRSWFGHSHDEVLVRGICEASYMWGEHVPKNQEPSVYILLEGCYDRSPHARTPLFPETLRSELHEVRSVIEAWGRDAKPQMSDNPVAGIQITGKASDGYRVANAYHVHLKVQVGSIEQSIKIDRWE